MKYLSLFSGIGGFELGIQQAYEERHLGIKSTDEKPRDTHKIAVRGVWEGWVYEEFNSPPLPPMFFYKGKRCW